MQRRFVNCYLKNFNRRAKTESFATVLLVAIVGHYRLPCTRSSSEVFASTPKFCPINPFDSPFYPKDLLVLRRVLRDTVKIHFCAFKQLSKLKMFDYWFRLGREWPAIAELN